MATADSTDGSVDDFLQRIRELGDKRDREDEERTRKLEEEILAGKQARQARRAERARSLSPEKDSPTVTPKTLHRTTGLLDSPSLTPRTRYTEASSAETPEKQSTPSLADTLVFPGSSTSSSSTAAPASVTKSPSQEPSAPSEPPRLSWQRRPQSTIRRERPVTMYARHGNYSSLEDSSDITRDDIQKSLESKDIDFFKQTEDKLSSTIRSRSELSNDRDSSDKVQLPGMDTKARPESGAFTKPDALGEYRGSRSLQKSESKSGRNSPNDFTRREPSPSPSRTSSILANQSKRKSMFASINLPPSSLGDSSELSSRDAAIEEAEAALRQPAMSPSQNRISPDKWDRTPSPTKGLGGFVQSAMLKREGSINKRWGPVPSGANLSRNNTTASTRPVSLYSTRPIDIHALSREPTPQNEEKNKSPDDSEPTKRGEEPRSVRNRKSSFLEHSRKYSFHDAPLLSSDKDSDLQTTPSRTFDQKRWSPTKSTWLESALRKSSEPRAPGGTVAPPKPLLPLDPLRKPPAFEARPSEKSHERKHSEVQPLPAPPAFSVKPRSKTISSSSHQNITSSAPRLTPVLRSKTPVDSEPVVQPKKESPKMDAPKAVFERPNSTTREPSPTDHSLPKPAAKPPIGPKPINTTVKQIDFRGVLKSRSTDKGEQEKEEVPFLSAMQRLKSTKQNTYVPKNEFREQLASGKSQLAQTGGPQKNTRIDPLKESVLTAKASLRRGSTSTSSPDLRRGSIVGSPEKEFPRPLSQTRTFTPSTTVKPLSSSPPAAEKPTISKPASQTRTFAPSKSMTPSNPLTDTAKVEEEVAKFTPARTLRGSRSSGASLSSPVLVSPTQTPVTRPAAASIKDRMNPNLAMLLQRGPAPASESASVATGSSSAQSVEEPRGKELSHMTKGRARGPKRRAPTKIAGAEKKEVETPRETPKAVELPKEVKQVVVEPIPVKVVAPEPLKARPEITRKSSDVVKSTPPQAQSPVAERKPQSPESYRTPLASTPGNVIAQQDVAKDLSGSIEEALKNISIQAAKPSQESPRQLPPVERELPKLPTRKFSFEMGEEERALPEPPVKKLVEVERELPALPTRKASQVSLSPSIEKKQPPAISPKPSFSRLNNEPESPLQRVASPSSPPPLPAKPTFSRSSTSSSISSSPSLQRKDSSSFRSVEPLNLAPATPPKPLTLASLQRNPSLSMRNIAPPRTPSVRQPALSSVQSTPERLISKKPEEIESEYANVRTIKFTIWEITADGKKTAMPLNQEHIFYDECMYIALHHLEIEGEGESYEVYLWVGDKVSEAAIQDVQIFGRQLAKEKNTQLILTKQQHESPRFLQAIGWIFLILSGRSPSSSSHLNLTTTKLLLKAVHKYEGVIFTQVPTKKDELKSAHPFLYSDGQGKKLWLWKGKDATAEDVGVARLVAFDLAGGGDVEEEIEGMERQGWNQSFGGQA